jgi:hypothetical protein
MPVIFSMLMLFKEIIAVHCENHREHMNKLCEKNVEFLNVIIASKYCGYCALKCSNLSWILRLNVRPFLSSHSNALQRKNATLECILNLHSKAQ